MEITEQRHFQGPFYVQVYDIGRGSNSQESTLEHIKVPLIIKIFVWYLLKGVTLTKDNLAKRN